MKEIDDMTLNEIRELKETYLNEFKELVKQFFDNHPIIDRINLYYNYREVLGIWPFDRKSHYFGDYVPLSKNRMDSIIKSISLKNEKI